jgi:hypothetical protein
MTAALRPIPKPGRTPLYAATLDGRLQLGMGVFVSRAAAIASAEGHVKRAPELFHGEIGAERVWIARERG